jgi:hypothetical protein
MSVRHVHACLTESVMKIGRNIVAVGMGIATHVATIIPLLSP